MKQTYQTIAGERIAFERPSAEMADYLGKLKAAAHDPSIGFNPFIDFLYGTENPLLDKRILPGRALVTQAVFANPLYRVMTDLLAQKQIQLAEFRKTEQKADFRVSVADAAKKLGITPAAVRAAIQARKMSGIFQNGQWWLSAETIASYKVSNRGPARSNSKKKTSQRSRPSTARA